MKLFIPFLRRKQPHIEISKRMDSYKISLPNALQGHFFRRLPANTHIAFSIPQYLFQIKQKCRFPKDFRRSRQNAEVFLIFAIPLTFSVLINDIWQNENAPYNV